MTFSEYTKKALRTCNNTGNDKIVEGAMGMSSESGEVLDEIKKWQYQGHDLNLEQIQNEIGDVCWYMAELIDGLGLDFETILLKNIKKLKQRYPNGFEAERSRHRE